MPSVRRTSLLDTIRADFAARGWAPDDLERFCMEDTGAAGTGTGDGGQGAGAGAASAPDLGALQKAIDDARAAGASEAERAAKEAVVRAEAAEKRAKELEEATQSESEKALTKAREEGAAEAKKASDEREAAINAKANQRLVAAEAKLQAIEAGVKSDRVAKFLRLIDVTSVTVDDDGNVDTKTLRKLVDDELEATPEFKAEAGRAPGSAPGGKPPAGDKPVDDYEAGRAAGKAEREASEARRPLLAGMTVLGQHSN